MSIREGLGYTLRSYDPCFSYNQDRFCCSNRGYHFRENVLQSECPLTPTDDYSAPRNYDPNDKRPLWLQMTGLVDPDPYTFTPQDRWHIWCGRMPCSVDQKGVPCQKTQPMCTNPADCSGRNVCGGRK
ncbi:hypothetical protein LCGC14_1586330 [marine sediment metagenome]|uniref:Uncharacterized protein n=1 Tax=marine sediment metagenome TaxID=412755 RepID=A0A0F9LFP6_9ZZZZ